MSIYTKGKFASLNSLDVPMPKLDSGRQQRVTLVDSARTADGVLRAQKIGRDQSKVEMTWAAMSPSDWATILQFFDANFYFQFTYMDMVTNSWQTHKFYIGDREATPYFVDPVTGKPKFYKDCRANVIDCGEVNN